MNTSRMTVGFVTSIGMLLAIWVASPNCYAVIVYYDGGPTLAGTAFLDAANWTEFHDLAKNAHDSVAHGYIGGTLDAARYDNFLKLQAERDAFERRQDERALLEQKRAGKMGSKALKAMQKERDR